MIEILIVYLLSKKNAQNACICGAPEKKYKALTFLLWFGGEFFGAIVGAVLGMGGGCYLLALLFAVGGGALSYYLAKNAH